MKKSSNACAYTFKLVQRILFLFVLVAVYQQCQASVFNSQGQASRNQVQDGNAASVSIVWTGLAGEDGTQAPFADTVFSSFGTFTLPNNTSIGVSNKRVATTITITPAQEVMPFTIRERLQIPASIIYTAKKQGSLVFLYSRTFADTANSALTSTSTVQFQITNSAGGQLNISRVDLRFDNDQIVRVVPLGTQISAVADINYSGAGLFDLSWEIATPASSQGTAFFSTLHTQRRYLGTGREAYVQSSELPTDETGTYFVRLNIRSPETGFEPVQIKYVVINSEIGSDPIQLEKIRLSTPLPKSILQKGTSFSWEPIDSTRAYQLELYEFVDTENQPIVSRSLEDIEVKLDWEKQLKDRTTGILVQGDKHEIELSAIARQHLRAGYNYRWRVIAIGETGNIIATSSLRTISVPK